jgi:NitT/TauT family transport system substrate-binding protein
VVFSSGPAVIEAIYAGRLDLAYVGPAPAINGFIRSEGREIVILAGCANNGVAIVARPDSGIHSFDDLAGRRVAVPSIGNTQFLSATTFLGALETSGTSSGGAARRGTILPVSSADAEILLAKGQVDAAWLPEPWAARLEHEGKAVVVAEERDLWPGRQFPAAVVVGRRQFVGQHPQLVARFLEIHRQSCEALTRETTSSAALIGDELARLTHKRFPAAVIGRGLARLDFSPAVPEQQLEEVYRMAVGCGFLRRSHVGFTPQIFLRSIMSVGTAPVAAAVPDAAAPAHDWTMADTRKGR